MTQSSQRTNEAVVEKTFRAWAEHDVDAFGDVYAPDVIHRNVDLDGLEDLQESAEAWFAAFPDLDHTVEATVAEGNMVVSRVLITGTHEGYSDLYGGLEPTGEEFEMLGLFMERVEDGTIVERWVVENHLSLLNQLNAVRMTL